MSHLGRPSAAVSVLIQDPCVTFLSICLPPMMEQITLWNIELHLKFPACPPSGKKHDEVMFLNSFTICCYELNRKKPLYKQCAIKKCWFPFRNIWVKFKPIKLKHRIKTSCRKGKLQTSTSVWSQGSRFDRPSAWTQIFLLGPRFAVHVPNPNFRTGTWLWHGGALVQKITKTSMYNSEIFSAMVPPFQYESNRYPKAWYMTFM